MVCNENDHNYTEPVLVNKYGDSQRMRMTYKAICKKCGKEVKIQDDR